MPVPLCVYVCVCVCARMCVRVCVCVGGGGGIHAGGATSLSIVEQNEQKITFCVNDSRY